MIGDRLKLAMKRETKLYGYQLHTVLWMFCLEKQILNKQYFVIGGNDLRFTGDPSVHCPIWKVKSLSVFGFWFFVFYFAFQQKHTQSNAKS